MINSKPSPVSVSHFRVHSTVPQNWCYQPHRKGGPVGERGRQEYAAVLRARYRLADKRESGRILDASCRALSHRPEARARGGGAGELTPTPAARALTRRLCCYGTVPLKEKLPLNFGPDAGVGPTISLPTRSQSGSRSAFRIHICKSPG